MQTANNKLFNREDTFFGVCEGLGTDIGIPPNLLRLAFAGGLFFNWQLALASYAALGVLVYAMRWLMPDRASKTAGGQDSVPAITAQNDAARAPEALAA